MEFKCPKCDAPFTLTRDQQPRFCSNCGNPISDLVSELSSTHLADIGETLPPSPSPDLDVTWTSSDHDNPARDSEANASQVGPYSVIKKLGQGGMGTVYEAVNGNTGQLVALKLLSRSLRSTEASVQRFRRESQIAASINHPRSTFVYDAGQHEGQFYIAMELMSGGTLKEVVEDNGPLPFGQAVDYILDLISGLQAAHDAGIVHRDIKPSNSFLDHDGRVKIGDFGLSKSFQGDSTLTKTGAFMGTPQFAAPEQLRADEVNAQTDIYALGGTLFYLLTGRGPFKGGAAQVITSIASEIPTQVKKLNKEVPRELSRIVAQTLEKDPARRFENLAEFRAALLPFSSRGASFADVGRRLAAFFMDFFIASMIAGVFTEIMMVPLIVSFNKLAFSGIQMIVVIQTVVAILYFAIPEWLWGRSLGKWLLGMRVIDSNYESPSLYRTTLRSLLVPGLTFFASTLPTMAALQASANSHVSSDRDMVAFVLALQIYALAGWIPTLLCLVTARVSNGLRGVHELISGTRVVRLAGALETKRLEKIPVTAPVKCARSRKYGAFEAVARYTPENSAQAILLGADSELDRHVWIFKGRLGEFEGDRRSLNRAARLRYIAESTDSAENQAWQATEAVQGSPLIELIGQQKHCSWQSVRRILQALACELDFAIDTKSLPESLRIDQVWVDQSGRLKLLDRSFPARESTYQLNEYTDASPTVRAGKLLIDLVSFFSANHQIPIHVGQFVEEMNLRIDPAHQEHEKSLGWAHNELATMADLPSSWKWDDRLGSLAVSFGFETSVFAGTVFGLGLLFINSIEESPTLAACVVGAISAAVAFAIGYFLQGGPCFKLSGVTPCRAGTLTPASRIRCGFRNLFTWLPVILILHTVLYVMHFKLAHTRQTGDPEVPLAILHVILLAMLPSVAITFIGGIWSVIWPARGIQDLLSGTELVRK